MKTMTATELLVLEVGLFFCFLFFSVLLWKGDQNAPIKILNMRIAHLLPLSGRGPNLGGFN